jgi:16S rRNA (adenine1518-N6/adenine1519-N6)-dimethyltransferase
MKNVQPRKQFAQHWLQSEQALEKIIGAADLQKSDRLLEIGPGTGILTRRLLSEIDCLVAVEIDRDLCKKLVKSFGNRNNFLLLQGDILSLPLGELSKPFLQGQNLTKVVANIPYNITGPILEKLLGKISQPAVSNYQLIVLLIQKEVAERLTAKPSTRAFGALTVRVQYLAECNYICDVPAKAFYPPPKVDSAVVRLRPRPIAKPAHNPKLLDNIVKLGFANKRKMLKNNLKSLIDCDRLEELLQNLGINPLSRAEDLSLEQWVDLSNQLQLIISDIVPG